MRLFGALVAAWRGARAWLTTKRNCFKTTIARSAGEVIDVAVLFDNAANKCNPSYDEEH